VFLTKFSIFNLSFLKSLPETIGNSKNLCILNKANNELTNLNFEIGGLENLEVLILERINLYFQSFILSFK
jgi:hypothetical protein